MVHWCPLPSYKGTEINLAYCGITEPPRPLSMSIPHHLTHASRPSYVPSFTLPSPYFSLAVPPRPSSSAHLSFRTHAASISPPSVPQGWLCLHVFPLILCSRLLSLSLAVHWFSLPLFTCPISFSLHIFIPPPPDSRFVSIQILARG